MIGYLKGRLLEVNADHVLVQIGGGGGEGLPAAGSSNAGSSNSSGCLGYEIQTNSRWLAELWGQEGTEIQFWIYTHVREDALQLFGFDSRAQKSLFLSLLKVNGIGPKLALGIISVATTDELIRTIESGDAKKLSKYPRVGKKTAEQMILTLQGKLVRVEENESSLQGPQKQIAFALKNLGFKEALVQEFVEQLPKAISVEDGVRQGLQALSHSRGES
jgi:Holliday junction DNA helicase RuvA